MEDFRIAGTTMEQWRCVEPCTTTTNRAWIHAPPHVKTKKMGGAEAISPLLPLGPTSKGNHTSNSFLFF